MASIYGDIKLHMTKMMAAVYYGPHDIRVQEVERPTYGPEGMLVRVRSCGVCNFVDIPAWERWTEGVRGIIGFAMGHEWSGEVVEIGSEVIGVKVGDKVYGYGWRPCYQCESCRVGDYMRCANVHPSEGETFKTHGAFAEYIGFHRVMEGGIIVYPQDMSYRDLALIEPLALSVGIARKAKAGDLVVVLGQEFVALGLTVCLKERGAKVITADISELRRKASKEVGADMVVDALKENVVQVVMDETRGKGADIVVVVDERPIAVQQAMSMVRSAGKIWLTKPRTYLELNPAVVSMHPVSFRIPDAGYDEHPIRFDASLFSMQSAWRTLGANRERWLEGVRILQSGKITAEKHVTHVFPLDKISEAFQIAADPYESIKVLVDL